MPVVSPATRQAYPVASQTAVSMEPLGAVARRDLRRAGYEPLRDVNANTGRPSVRPPTASARPLPPQGKKATATLDNERRRTDAAMRFAVIIHLENGLAARTCSEAFRPGLGHGLAVKLHGSGAVRTPGTSVDAAAARRAARAAGNSCSHGRQPPRPVPLH